MCMTESRGGFTPRGWPGVLLVSSQEMSLTRRLGAALVCLAVMVCWLSWSGLARPGAVVGPAGDPALCLGLAAWWCGAGLGLSQLLWGIGLLLGSAFSGIAPVWLFLLGLPAWLLVWSQAEKVPVWRFTLISSLLLSLFGCGGKLLLLSWGESSLTLSGPTLLTSFVAEFAPNLAFMTGFVILWGSRSAR